MELGNCQSSGKALQSKGFYGCLKIAQEHEASVIERLRNKGFYNVVRPEGNFKDYDFSAVYAGVTYRFECKKDLMSAKTGNVAIEIGFKNNPSGIAATKAEFYVIEINKTDWIVSVEVLKKMVRERQWFKEVKGGDNATSHLLLFKTDVITSRAKKL